MSSRGNRGFTILEAVVALAIVGLSGVAALEAVGGEIRAIERACEAYTSAVLAQDRLAAIAVVPPEALNPLPDSLARGTFAAPFTSYHWTATLRPVFGQRDIYELTVDVDSDRSAYGVVTRLYRPMAGQSAQ
jgi:prepilin-type N-terminal cleavage/methylation domain-containing protein